MRAQANARLLKLHWYKNHQFRINALLKFAQRETTLDSGFNSDFSLSDPRLFKVILDFGEVPAEVPLRGPAAEGGQTLSVARWESGGERSDELNKPSDSAQL